MKDITWSEWNKNKTPENNRRILKVVDKRIEHAVSRFRTSGIPESMLRTKAKKLALNQLNSYSESSGANISTHVSFGLRKLSDFVEDEKNIVRIPSNIRLQIPTFIVKKDKLKGKLGRMPNTQELSDYIKISPAMVGRLENSIDTRELVDSASQLGVNNSYESDAESDLIKRSYYDIFDPKEKLVYEYTFGVYGKKRMSPKDIAKETGIHEQKVRRLQAKIAKRIKG